jgi:ABC-type antimicrobial peptide transport system permease subunit
VKLSRAAKAWTTIVGVIADARTETLQDAGVPAVYASAYQVGSKHLAIFLRGQIDPSTVADRVREQVQLIDDTLPVYGAQTLQTAVTASLAARRFSMNVVALFAATALLMAAVGIYGVISYLVGQRTHEIGIRLVLGATRRAIVEMLMREGLALTAVGVCAGLACALAVAHVMAGSLYGVTPTDPVTFAGVAAVLAAVALLACYIPARRAVRIQPLLALRRE